jgi:uncharacterized glyoxalase superfamily protein PhnB
VYLRDVVPLLVSRNLPATIDFYTVMLGFTLDAAWPEGQPVWCQMSAGDARVMFMAPRDTGAPATGLSGTLYFYPEDVAKLWETVRELVAVERPLAVTGYGMREFSIKDPNGYELSFGQPATEEDGFAGGEGSDS